MAKPNPSLMVSAAGMFLNFISALEEELEKAGGSPAMLYFSQKKHARPMMELLARTIVESKLWKVPKSLILAEVVQAAVPDELQLDMEFLWAYHSALANSLTTFRFTRDLKVFSGSPPQGIVIGLPDVRVERCGDVIDLHRHRYVVTLWDNADAEVLYLAPAEWIDLDG